MNRPQTVIKAESLSRSFGKGGAKTTPLKEVNLRLSAGEIVMIMGPSGSGKSTLLAILSGLLRPDHGRVYAMGQDIWQFSPTRRERFRLQHCGFIFQGFNLLSSLTARQQLEIVLRWGEGAGIRQTRQRVDELLEEFGLADKGHLRPRELSGGEKQRVAIARALIKQPALCFADEPTSSLDWKHGRHVVELLRDAARKRGTMVLSVSHDARIIPFCDRVLHLEDGILSDENSRVLA
jgi:putative ABC transport system ATP-binding protein